MTKHDVSLAALYRERIADLAATLDDPEHRIEARNRLRPLIERVAVGFGTARHARGRALAWPQTGGTRVRSDQGAAVRSGGGSQLHRSCRRV
ncbi:hypothetical protein [Azospirillum sp. TSO35-2]|uniref:hypothetical protein n=1 Tax=Azospirillum sp. TSO35-2 TaxID=716796 RepID=UPI000D6507EE|nr:hypothetical protein [Azospirillum sp. TSO35-2]